MLFVYNVSIKIYFFLVYLFSFFNQKAHLWIDGRKGLLKHIEDSNISGEVIWFHFASLGEFEQGRPVLEKLKTQHPQKKIVVTFFSPSGYEIRKNSPLADFVFYLPLDTARNARKFINLINPEIAIFTKYEYWYHYFKELNNRKTPLYIISSIFREGQVFFKPYGGLHRKMLTFVSHFFVQDVQSQLLLEKVDSRNVTVSGDTRFDRVFENSKAPKHISIVATFCKNSKTFIGGSTWPEDEKLISDAFIDLPDWKLVIAPHEISEEKIKNIESLFKSGETLRYSKISETSGLGNSKVLIIDNIGMLSSLYQYGDIAFIGGGFGAGIHNTLEAAAFGLPVIFGPNYKKFREAKELIRIGAAFSVKSTQELKNVLQRLLDENQRKECSDLAAEYVREHTGATDIIVSHINKRINKELSGSF